MTLLLTGMFAIYPAAAQAPTPFDGDWDVVLFCPPHNEDDDDAKGYTHRFPGKIVAGELTATHGTEGQPSWHFLRGTVAPDGKADLRLDGIVKRAEYAVNKATRGKPYNYRVRATFEPAKGVGQRLGIRKCDFRFTKN